MSDVTEKMVEAAVSAMCKYFEAHGLQQNQPVQPEAYDMMRAALEAAERAGWRPIAELSEDGTYLCAWANRTDIQPRYLIVGDMASYRYCDMTHFRSLPAAPEGGA